MRIALQSRLALGLALLALPGLACESKPAGADEAVQGGMLEPKPTLQPLPKPPPKKGKQALIGEDGKQALIGEDGKQALIGEDGKQALGK